MVFFVAATFTRPFFLPAPMRKIVLLAGLTESTGHNAFALGTELLDSLIPFPARVSTPALARCSH